MYLSRSIKEHTHIQPAWIPQEPRSNQDSLTCDQNAGGVRDPLQGLITLQFETVDGVMGDPAVGVEWWDPAHQDGGGADVLIGNVEHRAGN